MHTNDKGESDRVIADLRQAVRDYARSRTTYQAAPAEGFDWVTAGYVATVMSIVFFPACIPGLVIGLINVIRGKVVHGLFQVAIALAIIGLIVHGLATE